MARTVSAFQPYRHLFRQRINLHHPKNDASHRQHEATAAAAAAEVVDWWCYEIGRNDFCNVILPISRSAAAHLALCHDLLVYHTETHLGGASLTDNQRRDLPHKRPICRHPRLFTNDIIYALFFCIDVNIPRLLLSSRLLQQSTADWIKQSITVY